MVTTADKDYSGDVLFALALMAKVNFEHWAEYKQRRIAL